MLIFITSIRNESHMSQLNDVARKAAVLLKDSGSFDAHNQPTDVDRENAAKVELYKAQIPATPDNVFKTASLLADYLHGRK
jgi:hypothetical protein